MGKGGVEGAFQSGAGAAQLGDGVAGRAGEALEIGKWVRIRP
jgi:hypothetical protein